MTDGSAADLQLVHNLPMPDAAAPFALPDGSCPVCGNEKIECDESCDDGNNVTEHCPYGEKHCLVCGSACRIWPGITSYCGDGRVDPAHEDCEPLRWEVRMAGAVGVTGAFGVPCTPECKSPPAGDDDGDGVDNEDDNCRLRANADQSDSDKNGVGDACDSGWVDTCIHCDVEELGRDGDSIGVNDNCPLDYNPDQASSRGTAGDVCKHVVRCVEPACRLICENRFGVGCR